ncbi:hypothetical protein OROMI_025223 [Orobanche minor]
MDHDMPNKNPGAMHKAQEEVRKMIHGKSRIEEEDLQSIKLPYLEAVIKESLRLYPVVPLIPRESVDRIVINGWIDPQVWEIPDEFLPERFIDSDIQFKGHDFEFIPFGSGRRICSGMYMAAATLELALSNLLYSFDWELPPGITKEEDIDTEIGQGVTMNKKTPLCLKPKSYCAK